MGWGAAGEAVVGGSRWGGGLLRLDLHWTATSGEAYSRERLGFILLSSRRRHLLVTNSSLQEVGSTGRGGSRPPVILLSCSPSPSPELLIKVFLIAYSNR